MPRRRPVSALLAAGAAAVLAGCGSETVHELPPAAEPPRSPPPAAPAAGELVRVGGRPEGVVVDPRTHLAAVAIARAEPRTRDPVAMSGGTSPAVLALVDVRARRVVRRVALPGVPRHLALDRPGGPVLVPAETVDRFLAISLPDGRVVARTRTGSHPHDLVAAAGGRIAIGDERSSALTVVRRGRAIAQRRVATQPGGVGSLYGGRLLAVVSVRERVLEIYDARTLRRLSREPAGVGPTHVACVGRGLCYVLDTAGDGLLVFHVAADGRGLELTRRVQLAGGPYGIALDARRRRLWVTLPGRDELAELPAHGRPHVLARIPTVRQPDSVAVDEATGDVVVTGRTGGLLQLVPSAAGG